MSNTTVSPIVENLIALGFQPDTPPASADGVVRTIGDWRVCISVIESAVFVDAFHLSTYRCWPKLVNMPVKYWDTVQEAVQAIEGAV